MPVEKTERNWKVAFIKASKEGYIVYLEVDGEIRSSGETCAEFGVLEYMTPKERAIIRKGLTARGRDKKP